MTTEGFVLATVGASLPILSFFLQSVFSHRAGTFRDFKNHSMTYFGDWLLVPFAASAMVVSDLTYIVLTLPLGILGSYLVHRIWAKNKDTTAKHFFVNNFERLSSAGLVHLLFSAIIFSLVISFYFTAPEDSQLTLYASSSLSLFALGLIFASHHMHKKWIVSDLAVATGLIVVGATKIIF